MVGKKAVKRKTVWRTLAIGADEAATVDGAANSEPALGGDAAAECLAGKPANVVTATASIAANENHHHHKHHHPAGANANLQPVSSTRPSAAANAHSYDGRTRPFAPYNRHQTSSSSSSYQHSNAKFGRRPSASASAHLAVTDAIASNPTPTTDVSNTVAHQQQPSHRWRSGHATANGSNDNTSYHSTTLTYPRHSERYSLHRSTTAASTNNSGYTSTGFQPTRRRPFNPRNYNGQTRSTFRIHRQQQQEQQQENTDATTSSASHQSNGQLQSAEVVEAPVEASSSAKPTTSLFNEDDYTRITTPRQDVLFKKGYLSRPKPYVEPSLATYVEGSGGVEDVIVLTPEEAIAAGLMHGYDPEHPYIGFYDATGMFYVNPYMNGLAGGYDPYSAGQQQLMLPPQPLQSDAHQYASDAFLGALEDGGLPQHVTCSAETLCTEAVCSHFPVDEDSTISTVTEVTDAVADQLVVDTTNAEAQNVEAVGVAESKIDAVDGTTHVIDDHGSPMTSSAEHSQSGDEPTSTDESQEGGASTSKGNGNEADGEETTPDVTVDGSAIDAPTSNIHPGFFPQIFYPYVFGAPAPYAMPVNDHSTAAFNAAPYDASVPSKFNRYRRRKRKSFRYISSTGTTTTTDYSEDDELNQNVAISTVDQQQIDDSIIDETLLHSELNDFGCGDVTFLAPSGSVMTPTSPTPSIVRNTTLNVHVPEFRPRWQQPQQQQLIAGDKASASIVVADDRDRDSDDSGVVSTASDVQPATAILQTSKKSTAAASATKAKSSEIVINSEQFPSIGRAASPVQSAAPSVLSYAAAIAQPAVVPEPEPEQIDTVTAEVAEKPVAIEAVVPTTKRSPRKSRHQQQQNTTKTNGKWKPKVRSQKPTATESIKEVIEEPTTKIEATVVDTQPKPFSFADLLKPTVVATSDETKLSIIADKLLTTDAISKPETVAVVEAQPTKAAQEQIVKQKEPTTTTTAPVESATPPKTWSTIRVKGKKRVVQHIEAADFWDEQAPEIEEPTPVETIRKVSIDSKPTIEVPIKDLAPNWDAGSDDEDATKVVLVSKSPRSKKNHKSKRSTAAAAAVKKVIVPVLVAKSPEKRLEKSPVREAIQAEAGDDDVEYNFVADPRACFANAIAPTQQSIFSSPRSVDKFGHRSAGMFGLKSPPLGSMMSGLSTAGLRSEDEDMVMRIMRSISSETESKATVETPVEQVKAIVIEAENEQQTDSKSDVADGPAVQAEIIGEKIEAEIIELKPLKPAAQEIKAHVIDAAADVPKSNGITSNGHQKPTDIDAPAQENGENITKTTDNSHDNDDNHDDDQQEDDSTTTTTTTTPIHDISSISPAANTNGNCPMASLHGINGAADDRQPAEHHNGQVGVASNPINVIAQLQIAEPTADVCAAAITVAPAEPAESLSDDTSTLSSLDDASDAETDDDSSGDDRTVIGRPLTTTTMDEYIEDDAVLLANCPPIASNHHHDDDCGNLLSCGEFYQHPTTAASPEHQSQHGNGSTTSSSTDDLNELIAHAELVVRSPSAAVLLDSPLHRNEAATVGESASKSSDSERQRNESARSSADSGIRLETGDDVVQQVSDELNLTANGGGGGGALTAAVSRWLVEQKEKSPEPIIRLPEDPALTTRIERSLQRFQISEMLKGYAVDEGDDADGDDDYEDDDYGDEEIEMQPLVEVEAEPSKNWQSNPLPASSASQLQLNAHIQGKRVASSTTTTTTSKSSSQLQINNDIQDDDDSVDILEYWDVDPMLTRQQQQQPKTMAGDAHVNYAQLLSEVGTRTTIDFLMSQQQKPLERVEAPTPGAKSPAGEYLRRHQFGCALM